MVVSTTGSLGHAGRSSEDIVLAIVRMAVSLSVRVSIQSATLHLRLMVWRNTGAGRIEVRTMADAVTIVHGLDTRVSNALLERSTFIDVVRHDIGLN